MHKKSNMQSFHLSDDGMQKYDEFRTTEGMKLEIKNSGMRFSYKTRQISVSHPINDKTMEALIEWKKSCDNGTLPIGNTDPYKKSIPVDKEIIEDKIILISQRVNRVKKMMETHQSEEMLAAVNLFDDVEDKINQILREMRGV